MIHHHHHQEIMSQIAWSAIGMLCLHLVWFKALSSIKLKKEDINKVITTADNATTDITYQQYVRI